MTEQAQWVIGVILALMLVVIGALGTLIVWNLTLLSNKVEAVQTIVYDTRNDLTATKIQQVELSRQLAEIKDSIKAALIKSRR
ncbi:MAG: hypothetical protein ACREQ5_01145 [Candidatus Dormibacteria bacterium]